ncbi:acyltransferase family protein [Methylobacterium oryzisoli]|uniref:acyltransferase family protein n=1 Tax=Methylobacterium oryzisoli TaxID=3385502 RepID=UPI0038923BFD
MTRPSKLPQIQILRALAALMVAVSHALFEASGLAARTQMPFAPAAWLPWNAGVDMFFVISGFIIVHAAGPLHGRAGARRSFIAHRIARVVPLYWIVTTAYLGAALAAPGLLGGGHLDPALAVASYLFWPMARPDGSVLPLYSLGWTLNYEMAFYALFALCLPLRRRLAVGAVAGGLVLLAALHALAGRLPVPLAFWSDPIVLEFAFGAALGLTRAEGIRLQGAVRLVLAAGGFVLLALAGEPAALPRWLAWGVPAAMLVAAAGLGRGGEPDSAPLRAAVLLGDASYALYLVHPFAVRGVRVLAEATGAASLGPVAVVLAMLALACAAAVGVHRLVERPLTARLRTLLERRLTRMAAAAQRPAR